MSNLNMAALSLILTVAHMEWVQASCDVYVFGDFLQDPSSMDRTSWVQCSRPLIPLPGWLWFKVKRPSALVSVLLSLA